ncbi:MAG: DegT/DnrJ/EryC1/StrS family aminotransferase [Nitrospira sp.]|nr:DegT/DnrJ/EryC1/StrS family aminotransferase [Nitrospira sp.]MDH4246093.1 DegT/DnrJ/EryC1/StrS family aminotransferase [Nitrospira sp.]MDH4355991.1 DegT/DnrJ/EryC1/StrS family aminotransferase [Nitrospira sp.]MDH5317791.1 DegT/DnrJ/EryC1/StrS family aminotransferase [Nitrospira sp.]
MGVPLLDLKAHHEPLQQEIMAALEQTFRSQSFILGPEVGKLEERVATYCQAKHGVGVTSGTDALLIALMALGIGPGDEVVTTPYSFFATAGAVVRLGAKPVLVDIDPVTYNIAPSKIDSAVTSKTKAIIPVHLYGQCADMGPIMDLAKRHNFSVIEDAAQAIGAEYRDGQRACSMGTIGCLSFFPSKNLGCLGDGGMVVTNNPELAEQMRVLRVHGSKPKYYHKLIGGNFRLDTIQAAVLNVKLNYLDGWTKKRQENADRYETLFQQSSLVQRGKVRLPEAVYRPSGAKHYHIYNQFVLRVERRDDLMAYLKQKGIGAEIYYPVPFHLQECFRYLGYRQGDFPESERAANETVAIPIYPELTLEQQTEVVKAITAFYQ